MFIQMGAFRSPILAFSSPILAFNTNSLLVSVRVTHAREEGAAATDDGTSGASPAERNQTRRPDTQTRHADQTRRPDTHLQHSPPEAAGEEDSAGTDDGPSRSSPAQVNQPRRPDTQTRHADQTRRPDTQTRHADQTQHSPDGGTTSPSSPVASGSAFLALSLAFSASSSAVLALSSAFSASSLALSSS
jgi:hypothetical protein